MENNLRNRKFVAVAKLIAAVAQLIEQGAEAVTAVDVAELAGLSPKVARRILREGFLDVVREKPEYAVIERRAFVLGLS